MDIILACVRVKAKPCGCALRSLDPAPICGCAISIKKHNGGLKSLLTEREIGMASTQLMDLIIARVNRKFNAVESTDQCNTCVKTSYFDHFLVGNYGTHETVVYQAR